MLSILAIAHLVFLGEVNNLLCSAHGFPGHSIVSLLDYPITSSVFALM